MSEDIFLYSIPYIREIDAIWRHVLEQYQYSNIGGGIESDSIDSYSNGLQCWNDIKIPYRYPEKNLKITSGR